MKALIKVGYGCNDHCAFCHTLDVRHIQGEAREVVAKIHRAKELGHSMIVLSGGEPTIRPELLAWARLSASLDMDFGLVTNGRMLAYAERTDALLASRLRYVYLSLHGGNAKVHNLMVRSQAFEETYGALANLTGKGIDLHVNCVVTKHNMKHLRGVIDAMAPYPDAQLKFSMVEPKGGGDKLFARLMPKVTEVASYVRDALAYGDEKGIHAMHGALPLCLMPGYETRFDDLKTHRFRTMTEIGEPDLFPVDDLNKVQPSPCDGCALRGPCPGLYRGYHEAFGDGEIKARKDVLRSNSYDYVFERRVTLSASSSAGGVASDTTEPEKAAPDVSSTETQPTDTRSEEERAHCELRDGHLGIVPWSPGRDLFVRHQGRLALFRAESRDFSDAEMESIKGHLGQVYYDVSRKVAPDDFARDLAKLVRADDCRTCPHDARCTGMYEPSMDPVFTTDDARLRALLQGLRGRVVDVGCGEGPYAEVMAESARTGSLSYLGFDPDAARVAELQAAWPWAQVAVGTGEALPVGSPELPGEGIDAVLFLRSWNHLHDPMMALARVYEALKPGGRLIVADNVAFGLARTPRHTQRAQASRAAFEHFRNDDGVAARAMVEAASFAVTEHWTVGPASSNQWVLDARKPSA